MLEHIFRTDWLASSPVFYNQKTKKVSSNINDVIEFNNFEFDIDGLYLYLMFGYSALGRTPIRDVYFLSPNSELLLNQNSGFTIIENEDPVPSLLNKDITLNPADVLSLLENKIQKWEYEVKGDIIIPSSGGYDSRLLNCMISDKKRIKAFSYGTSPVQENSFECVRAREYTKRLGIDFHRVELGHFHQYIDEWYSLYGISTHLHGMYHLEFYHQIINQGFGNNPLLSGIIGDAWAGAVHIQKISEWKDVQLLSYSHGMNANPSFLLKKPAENLLEKYYEHEKYLLEDERYRIISSMRMKIMLLSYLMRVPDSLGFKPWSPFLDMEVAIAMLRLPEEQREGRKWQDDFFKKWNVNNQSLSSCKSTRVNMLDRMAMGKVPLVPLNKELLKEIIDTEYIDWINKNISSKSFFKKYYYNLFYLPYIKEGIKIMKFKNHEINAYNAYLVLKPLEFLLQKRNFTYKNDIKS